MISSSQSKTNDNNTQSLPYIQIENKILKDNYAPQEGTDEWCIYKAGKLWQKGLDIYSKHTAESKDVALAYMFNAIVINDDATYIRASSQLVPSLFKNKPFVPTLTTIAKEICLPGAEYGMISTLEFSQKISSLRSNLEEKDDEILSATLNMYEKFAMSSTLFLHFMPISDAQSHIDLLTRVIIHAASLRKLLSLRLPSFIEGLAIQSLNNIPVASFMDEKPLPSLTATTALSGAARDRILKKINASHKWAFLLSLEFISFLYYKVVIAFEQLSDLEWNKKREGLKKSTQFIIDILDVAKNYPAIEVEDSTSSQAALALLFPFPFSQIYRPRYLSLRGKAIFNMGRFQEAKNIFNEIASQYSNTSKVIATESLYQIAVCIAMGSDSVKDVTKFDVEVFKKAERRAEEEEKKMKSEGIFVEFENEAKKVVSIV